MRHFNKVYFNLLLIGILSLALQVGCGERGGNSSGGSDDQTPPVFKGIILAYSPQKDKINLHWAQASDNVTQLDKIKYNIYASPLNDINNIYQDSNLVTLLINQTNYSIENLLPGQTYYCLVVAEDELGNRNNEHKIFEVSTMPDDLQTQMMPKDMTRTDITAVTNSEDNFTFTGVDANDLTSNDIIIVDNELGQILKKVVSTEITGNGVTVTTEDASLSEVIKSGVLKSNVLLTDLNDIPSVQEIALKTTIAGKKQTTPTKQYNDPDGFFKVTESISDNHYLPHRTLRKSRFDLYEYQTSLNESVNLGYSIKFTPGIETEARYTESWGVDPAEYVKVVAKGMITIDALAGYYINGESKLSLKKQLLNRGITLTYSVGPVPVYQEIYLEIFAELNMDANANLTMEANLKASKDIEIGVEWDREKGWNTIRNEGFDQEITFNVEAGGTVVGTLKVYPVISVRFYKAAKSSLYVVPTLALDSAARIIPPPFELTKFDVNFLVDSYIAANLKVLGLVLAEWESNHYELLNIPIFSLPEITLEYSGVSLSAGTTQKYSLGIKDGVHNTIPPENIEWSVEPNVGVTLEPINGNTEATLTVLSEGEYTIKVSAYGDGFLGTIGTRYASFPLTVIGVSDTTLNVNINGTGNGTVISLPEGINCGAVCSASFINSSSVTLTATPASGSTFPGWSGECTGTGTCTVVMDMARSVTASFSITDTTIPSVPTGVSATGGNGQVTLSWNSVSGATGYNIYYSTTSGVMKTTGTQISGVTSPYTHTGLTNGTTYYYVVTAANSYGESAESNEVSAKPQVSTILPWAKTYNGIDYYADYDETYSDYDEPYSIQQTSDGGYIVAGWIWYSRTGGSDFWVLRLDGNGYPQWQKTYGDTSYTDSAYSIQQTSDGGYIVAGGTTSFGGGSFDFWVLKLDGNGDPQWQKTYGGVGSDIATSIQQTLDGGYIVAGYTEGFGAGPGTEDAWVLKLDGNGNVTWQKTYSGAGGDYASSIQQTSDGGYIVAGWTSSFDAGWLDAWVLKLDGNGNVTWQKTYGGGGSDSASSIQQTSDGGYIVAGETNSTSTTIYDFWVLKLDGNGNVTWQKTYGGGGSDSASSIQQTSDGGYIVAGETNSTSTNIYDFWVLKLDGNGNVTWQKAYGRTVSDSASSIQQTSDGGYIVAGGYYDFWVLKLNSNGTINFNPSSGASTSDTSVSGSNTSATSVNTNATVTNTSVTGANTNVTGTNTNAVIQQQAP